MGTASKDKLSTESSGKQMNHSVNPRPATNDLTASKDKLSTESQGEQMNHSVDPRPVPVTVLDGKNSILPPKMTKCGTTPSKKTFLKKSKTPAAWVSPNILTPKMEEKNLGPEKIENISEPEKKHENSVEPVKKQENSAEPEKKHENIAEP